MMLTAETTTINHTTSSYGDDFVAHVRPAHEGSAETTTILWIHGYTLDARSWAEVWDYLPEFRHVGIDLPGHGQSADFQSHHTLPEIGQMMAELAQKENIRHLVGLSFGGMFALQTAVAAPETFDTLTLGAPALGGGPTAPEVGELYKKLYQLTWRLGIGPWLTDVWMKNEPYLFAGAEDHPERWAMLRELVSQHKWLELNNPATRQMQAHPQQPLLSQIQAQTHVVVGDKEMPAFVQIAQILADEIPHCEQIHLTGGVHHLCLLQVPEQTAQIVRQQVQQPF